MPQIFIEYTANIKDINFKEILAEIHSILSRRLPTKIESCKSRIIKHNDYLIGNGNINNALVNIDIAALPGREEELLRSIALEIQEILECSLKVKKNSGLVLQVCVSIKNLPNIYYKSLHIVK
jgi:5-carboxymethyl-2-hydroxymuconate isomerase